MAFNYIKNSDNFLTIFDPIYGKISVPYPYSEIVLTKEMLRLSDISQNGFSQYEYPNLANNDRLSHSVGAFYVMSLILSRLEEVLKQYNITLSEDDKDIALCSMLLHDVGHGPFSHSLEVVSGYSHEKRTTDILLGNTEVGRFLEKLYGKEKLRKIASFIADINDSEKIETNSFTKLLKTLVSNQTDADRIDYLKRDAHYVGIIAPFVLDKLISSFSVVVNNSKEYELLFLKQGISSLENILIHRYQMYRDVYLSPIAVLGDELFRLLIERYRNNSTLHDLPLPKAFKAIAEDFSLSNLDDFLNMSDKDFKYAFEILINSDDELIAYLCNKNNICEYELIENTISVDKIKRYLSEIFDGLSFDNTLSIISTPAKVKLYKKEKLNVQNGNQISDLPECTSLIRHEAFLEKNYTFFNPELLRLELGLTKEEFKSYEEDIRKMIEELNKKPEEFELKYIVNDNVSKEALKERILNLFLENGFKVVRIEEKENNDVYFDKIDLPLYQKGGSLRIRKAKTKDKIKYKGTYKMPKNEGEVYSSRYEFETSLDENTFSEFVSKMSAELLKNNVNLNFSEILSMPILNSATQRTDVILEKNGMQVCLSLDDSVYTNHYLDEIMAMDRMIEIEATGNINDRVMLNEIHSFITAKMPNLTINKQSKYERGVIKTLELFYSSLGYSNDNIQDKGMQMLLQRLKTD